MWTLEYLRVLGMRVSTLPLDIRRWVLLAGALFGALALPSQKTMCLRQKAKRCLSATWLNEHLSKGEDEVQDLRHRGCHAT